MSSSDSTSPPKPAGTPIADGAERARQIVAYAVRRGVLPRPHGYMCVDCGGPACAYDHRDYGKPLEVVPVCKACNALRGTALPARTGEAKPGTGFVLSQYGVCAVEFQSVDFYPFIPYVDAERDAEATEQMLLQHGCHSF